MQELVEWLNRHLTVSTLLEILHVLDGGRTTVLHGSLVSTLLEILQYRISQDGVPRDLQSVSTLLEILPFGS